MSLRDKLSTGLSPAAALRDARHASTRDARLEAIAALGELASEGAPTVTVASAGALLCELLGDADALVRQGAALACAELGTTSAAVPLAAIAASDPSPAARQGAVIALGRLGGPRSLDVVAAALEDDDADVRFQAVGALAELGDASDSARERAARALPDRLADDDAEVRGSAAAALGDLDIVEACEALSALLDDREPATRLEAAAAMSRLGDARGVTVLAEMLEAESIGLLAAQTLYRYPDARARAALERAVTRRFGDPVVAAYAAATLAKLDICVPSARARLDKSLHSRKAHVAALSIELLGELSLPWSTEALREFAASRAGRRWRDELDAALGGASG